MYIYIIFFTNHNWQIFHDFYAHTVDTSWRHQVEKATQQSDSELHDLTSFFVIKVSTADV